MPESALLLNPGSTKVSANRAASIPRVEEEHSGSPKSGQLPLIGLFRGVLEHGTLHQMSRQMHPNYAIQGTQKKREPAFNFPMTNSAPRTVEQRHFTARFYNGNVHRYRTCQACCHLACLSWIVLRPDVPVSDYDYWQNKKNNRDNYNRVRYYWLR